MSELSNYLIYLLACLILVFYTRLFYINRRKLKFAWHNKGFFIPILPIVGTTYVSIFAKGRNILSVANWFYKYVGAPLNLWIGHTYHYITIDAEEIRIILTHPKCINKGAIYSDVERIFGFNSLAFVSQDTWRARRRHFSKSFKPAILKAFIDTFDKCSRQLVDDLKKLNGEVVSSEFMNTYIFKVLCVTAFGLDENKCCKEIREFAELRIKIEEAMTTKILCPCLPFSVWSYLFPTGRRTMECMKRCKFIVEKIVRGKKLALANYQDYIENSNEVPLLDLILSYNNKLLSAEEIFTEIMLFSSAGTESSSLVLHLGLTLVAMHKEIQENIYNEVMMEIGDTDINFQNVASLKYTEAVIFEVLRLIPVVPMVSRNVGADIDFGSKVIPKGTDFVVDFYHLHRDPRYWKDPEKFDPTRFLPENINKIVPYSYMPFSAGPRDCIGKNHALTLLKINYANVIRSFELLTNQTSLSDLELCSVVAIYPNIPADLRFKVR